MMPPLDYESPLRTVRLADNFIFRVLYGACGLVCGVLMSLAALSLPGHFDYLLACPPTDDRTTLLPFTKTVADIKLHWLFAAAIVVFHGGAIALAIQLLIHAYRHRHTRGGWIAWPTHYWLRKAILTTLLLFCGALQIKLYNYLRDDLDLRKDGFSNIRLNDGHQSYLAAIIVTIPFGLMPALSLMNAQDLKNR